MGNNVGRSRGDDELRRVIALWRKSGIKPSSVVVYRYWVLRFKRYCEEHKLAERRELTRVGAQRFARSYCSTRSCKYNVALASARGSLRAWAYGLRTLGVNLPPWQDPNPPRQYPRLIQQFAEYRNRHAGVTPCTIRMEADLAVMFLAFLSNRRVRIKRLRTRHVDAFVEDLLKRWARRTVSDACSRIRAFLRFLNATGHLDVDVAASVVHPRMHLAARPPRALPWAEVRKILGAIDIRNPSGRRDKAAFLLITAYGMGAAEVVSLGLDDIDWRQRILHVRRRKTSAAIELPLIDSVARALQAYVRHTRPAHAVAREVFVSVKTPHPAIGTSALRYQLRKYATVAGIARDVLGTHSLRHSYACRHVELGTSAKIVGDILGHQSPKSTSVYVRVASKQMRSIALAVPR